MVKQLICTKCGIISRGIVGNCRHIEEEVIEAISVERRQFEPLINILTRQECTCPIGPQRCPHRLAKSLKQKLSWTLDPANGIYEFPDDFDPSLLPSGLDCAPVQEWDKGCVATFDDTHPQFVLFSRTFRKDADHINLYIQGEPRTYPDIKMVAAFQFSWRHVVDSDAARVNGPLHEAGEFNHTCEARAGGPNLPYLWSKKLKLPMDINAGVRYDLILGRASLMCADTLIGDFNLSKVRVEED